MGKMKHGHYSKNNPSDFIPIVIEEKAKPIIQEFLQEYKPDVIVEFGTNQGGCTLLFHEELLDSRLISFDIINNVKKRYLFNDNVIFVNDDILIREHQRVINLLTKKPHLKKFLWCDNGNKKKEIEMYSKYLSKGDLLGVHDYGTECKYSMIKKSIAGKYKWLYKKELQAIKCTVRLFERK